jgi:hypothetical protein
LQADLAIIDRARRRRQCEVSDGLVGVDAVR